jgi:K+-transporting ATPase ATPase C chain
MKSQTHCDRSFDSLLKAHASAPFGGLAGEPFVNVLEINLLLRSQYGAPPS